MGADGRRLTSGGAMRGSGRTERRWGKAFSPYEEEMARKGVAGRRRRARSTLADQGG
jgi:hypothetical protein